MRAVVLAALFLVACKNEPDFCQIGTSNGCDLTQVCEVAASGGSVCATPLVVRGRIVDTRTGDGVPNARVVGLGAGGRAVTRAVETDGQGVYEIAVPANRLDNGAPITGSITLRVEAPGFQAFPTHLRTATPIDTGAYQPMGASLVVMNAGTDASLIAFAGGPGFATLSGQVEAPTTEGQVLVVAELAGGSATGFWSIADRDGNYLIVDLPGGNYTVRAFHESQRYQSVPVFLGTGQIGEAPDIRRTQAASGRVVGTLELEGAGSAETAVQLVVESTYGLGGSVGATPPGLRLVRGAGSFTFDNVPAGRYIVLAGLGVDGRVRPRDADLPRVEVVAGADATLAAPVRVLPAIALLEPAPAGTVLVTTDPDIRFQDVADETGYQIAVWDARGLMVWDDTIGPQASGTVTVPYLGPVLAPGMYYQARVDALGAGNTLMASSDELVGIFTLAP